MDILKIEEPYVLVAELERFYQIINAPDDEAWKLSKNSNAP